MKKKSMQYTGRGLNTNPDSVPGIEQWGQPSDIDEKYTMRRFLGWSLQEAEDFFVENPYSACEELFYMPKSIFKFYLRSLVSSVKSEKHESFERTVLYLSLIYCINKAMDKGIPEVNIFVDLGRHLLDRREHFELSDEAATELQETIRQATLQSLT